MGWRAPATPLHAHMVGDSAPALRLLLGTAVFLLLITWANGFNLCLARAERQRREVAVARALGARAGHVVRRFLSEAVLLAGAGGALGLALAYAAVVARFGFGPDGIPRLREVGVDAPALGVAVALTGATAVLLGGVSYLSARRAATAGALTGALGRLTAGRREQVGRRALVAAQFAVALTLLIGAALMAGSFWRLTQERLGFEPGGAIAFRLPTPPNAYGDNYYHAQVEVHDALRRSIRSIPGVEAVEAASSSAFPLTPVPSYFWMRLAVADRPEGAEDARPSGLLGFATPGYFEALGIPILQGRSFLPEDTRREGHGVVLSRSLARALFGARDPIGRRVRWAQASSDPDYTVGGVVGDVPSETIREGPSAVLYFPNLHPPAADTVTGVVHIYVPSNEMYVVRTELPPATVIPAVREAVRAVDPKLVMTRVGPLEGLVADSMARTRLTMLLLLVGAGAALLLGVIGIYGILSYTVTRRTPELGVRIALGASPASVVRLVVRQGAAVVLAGAGAGLLAAFGLTRFMDALLYEVSPGEPAAFVGMSVLLLLVALAASYVPARRAGRIDPTRALKVN
jgi:putative ABC transport system permease protein